MQAHQDAGFGAEVLWILKSAEESVTGDPEHQVTHELLVELPEDPQLARQGERDVEVIRG